jgi:SAM-dependent methyltransferase
MPAPLTFYCPWSDFFMSDASKPASTGEYVLATGEAAAYRLSLLHGLYGPGTRRLLLTAGLRPGMHVADVGCGVGMVTGLLSEILGGEGSIVGVDFSAAQLVQARARLADSQTSVTYVEASATQTGLPPESFDLVYCRFLLMHLSEPEAALRHMKCLLKPQGILVCEDGDLTSAGSQPLSALDAFADLFGRMGPKRGVDYTLGRRLYPMILDAGFTSVEASLNQPVAIQGEPKRLFELSVAEAGPGFVDAGLLTADQLNQTVAEMRRLADDPSVLAIMPRMTQVWARKELGMVLPA